ncbi:carbonate dehydratase, eukaryotic-type [Ancylostoma duodenale]|uniref:Carbonate dehydratase, eukaryotic-type n=1 Tax=Ancylostoma duodenale TaxID=51022 RepID=A0A0C2D586_9BILA|nr:carbonate dehydratase, eukaryotic-type [Ancylostoma duodenale]
MEVEDSKGSEEWGYVDKSAWKKTCKTGTSQSPIDLDITQAVMVNWDPLKFHNYDARGDIVAENNGHTGGNLKGSNSIFIGDGNDRFGSEHTLAGLHYPLEEGLNETNAHHVPGGVAVVAVQFQIAPKGEALFDLEKVTEATNSSDTKGDVPSYSPGSLLPPDTSTFFRYTGSLTTPPCSEGVIWTILAHPNLVTDTQVGLDIRGRHCQNAVLFSYAYFEGISEKTGRC